MRTGKYAPSARLCAMFVAVVMLLTLAGCAGKAPRTPSGVMDSPEHHFRVGLDSLNKGEPTLAGVEFDLALSVDKDHAKSIAGKAVVLAMRGQKDAALEWLDSAQDAADDLDGRDAPAVRSEVRALGMWVHEALYEKNQESREDMLDAVDDLFEDAFDEDPGAAAPHFRRGEAHLRALGFRTAEEMYRRAKELDGGYAERANERWKLVQDVNRAAPGTSAGGRIALVKALTRADMAALLVEELGLDSFYERTATSGGATYVPPSHTDNQIALDTANTIHDIAAHPLAADIRRVLHHGVKGLEPYPDRSFRPDDPVSRAEAAMIFEDIIIRATGRDELATKFIGQDSTIPDLSGDHPAFNAVMVCITRAVMDADVRSGLFRPLDTVSGVEALLAVKRLKSDLRLF